MIKRAFFANGNKIKTLLHPILYQINDFLTPSGKVALFSQTCKHQKQNNSSKCDNKKSFYLLNLN